jgi:NadR type nicotinamide-nucleotide adenylyltransferase
MVMESYISLMHGIVRIAIVGPESTGKTTLAEALGTHYGCACTKEYARIYLEEFGPSYTEPDLLRMVHGQLMAESDGQAFASSHGQRLLICDTDMITVRIWSQEKFGRCHPTIEQLARDVHYDLWLLCSPDIPWEPDPLRENPLDRDRLFAVYEAALIELGKPYAVVAGTRSERMNRASDAVDRLLGSRNA